MKLAGELPVVWKKMCILSEFAEKGMMTIVIILEFCVQVTIDQR